MTTKQEEMIMTINEIDKTQAKELITKYHYLGNKGFRSQYIYGVFDNGELIGCAVYHGLSAPETAVGCFGLARNEQDNLMELGRLVLKPDYNGKNYGSFLVGNSIKELKKKGIRAVISYADSSRHTGAIYKACNFGYYGLSTPKKDFYVNGKIQERGKTKGVAGEWKPRPQKHRYIYLIDKKLKVKWIPYEQK